MLKTFNVPSICIDIIETDVLHGRDPNDHDADDARDADIRRITSLLRGSFGFFVTSKVNRNDDLLTFLSLLDTRNLSI